MYSHSQAQVTVAGTVARSGVPRGPTDFQRTGDMESGLEDEMFL